jgi:NADPH:quinone reductase-like Zn-dependent oxidoreductase
VAGDFLQATERLERLAAQVAAGLRPHITEVIPLQEAVRAHELVGNGHTRGKIVLEIS